MKSGKNYFEHNFNFVPHLQHWAKQIIEKDKAHFHSRAYWDDELKDIRSVVDEELRSLGLPLLMSVHIFGRPPHNVQEIHLDNYKLRDGRLLKKQVAYNIPIVGADSDCFFEWYDGAYNGEVLVAKTNHLGEQTPMWVRKWIDEPALVERVVQDRCYFLNISLPHRAISGSEYRAVASLRFQGNMTVDDYREKLYVE